MVAEHMVGLPSRNPRLVCNAKDLLAHLAYWERATAGQVQDFETGAWKPPD